ncbi:nitroreductase [Nonomuraea deserti]|uniref:nitroreductase n=1 Tax=Nonomuraea deserti TaxID=1848322 RepID=UPI001C7037EF|nr:nitroreductase [Nonomuraea deserti]
MDVYETVTSRRAVRGFTDQPVPLEALKRVLSAAAWAPSGSNLQPWHVYVVTGEPLAEIKKRAGERVATGDPWDEREYEMYPPALKSPYRERRSAFGRERYGALGIERDDWEARQRAAAENWDCFGAPAALFCYIDRDMGLPQWADLGMYLQTVMLLLRAEGLHSCPQMAWSVYRKTVAEVLHPPEELILFCGISVGFEDVTVDHVRTGRAPLEETVTFVDGSGPAIACGRLQGIPWSGRRRPVPATVSTRRARTPLQHATAVDPRVRADQDSAPPLQRAAPGPARGRPARPPQRTHITAHGET